MSKVRAAVIGSTGRGNYGHGLDVAWLDVPNVELVAVADDNPTGLAAEAKKLKVEQAFTDYRKLLDEVKPEVVSVCQRWIDRHHEMLLACLERGIHVYSEKPFCRTLAEADQLVAAAERTHAKLAIAHQTRYSPRIEIAKQLIANGKIGKVLEYRGRGKDDQRGGGEDLWVLGTHIMDLIRNFSGGAEWCFARVNQNGRPITKSDVAEGNEGLGPLAGDDVRAMYGLADGTTGYFASRRNATGRTSRFGLQIYGSEGVIEIITGHVQPTIKLLVDSGWSPARSKKQWVEVSTAGIGEPEPVKDGGLHVLNVMAIEDLLAAIKENRDPKGNIYQARGATEMIVAVFESHRVGGPVTLPLKTRQNPLTLLEA
ncbi:MAG: Gfo/Idh/MocA family oxidoreductase [Planctomycetes bacterium]|nr:Gfo/Idh/MocA family oxidoreductase [Planctomycetota bacterium]